MLWCCFYLQKNHWKDFFLIEFYCQKYIARVSLLFLHQLSLVTVTVTIIQIVVTVVLLQPTLFRRRISLLEWFDCYQSMGEQLCVHLFKGNGIHPNSINYIYMHKNPNNVFTILLFPVFRYANVLIPLWCIYFKISLCRCSKLKYLLQLHRAVNFTEESS